MRQDQGIKGFTLLELIVTVLIISIVSAIAYPGYSSWKKDREVRAATEKVASLIANISTLTQRGSFAYSQLLILPKGLSGVSGISNNTETIFITRGWKDNKFSKELTDNNGSTKCNADFPGNWNEFNGLQFYEFYDPRASIDKVEVKTHLRSTSGSAVCFGRGGNYYKVYGSLTKSNNKNINLDGTPTANYIIMCHGKTCDLSSLDEPTYLIKWSRFGNISKYRYKYKSRNPIQRYNYKLKDAWQRQ